MSQSPGASVPQTTGIGKEGKSRSMKEFKYVIRDEVGIHARPAGLLVKEAQRFSSAVQIRRGDRTADGKKLFALMALGGDLGCSSGPTLVGLVTSAVGEMKAGLLAAIVFPVVMIAGLLAVKRMK